MKPLVHVILRSFNSPRVVELLQQLSLSNIRPESVTIVVDAKRDFIDTPKLIHEKTYPFPILVQSLDDYGWAKALNTAIVSLSALGSTANEFIMAISNEVRIEPDGIEMLLHVASKDGASCGYALFEGRDEPSYTVPRNTCAIWNMLLFSTVGEFDERLDSAGGMEDYEMVMRAFDRLHLLPFAAERRMELLIRDPVTFAQKLSAEERAMKTIDMRYSDGVLKTLKAHLTSENKT